MFFLFATVITSSTTTFSSNLGWSWISFMPSFLTNWCTAGDYLCTYGYLISPTVALLGVILLLCIILSIVGCFKKTVKFRPFYTFAKGLLRWTEIPLVYSSTNTIISKLKGGTGIDKNFIAAIIVLAFFVIWSIVELIGYKCTDKPEENNWKKWIEWISNLRVIIMAALVSVGQLVSVYATYVIYAPLVIYVIVYSIKYRFTFVCF